MIKFVFAIPKTDLSEYKNVLENHVLHQFDENYSLMREVRNASIDRSLFPDFYDSFIDIVKMKKMSLLKLIKIF